MIKVEYRGELGEMCRRRLEELDVPNVAALLRHIKSAYGPAVYREAKKMLITVDGTSIALLKVYRTPLLDGQTVRFLPICGGG